MQPLKTALASQYHAAFTMLRIAIERCPEDLWLAGTHPRNTWRIAYHAVFYTDWYLYPTSKDIVYFKGHNIDAPCLWEDPPVDPPYTQAHVVAYLRAVNRAVEDRLEAMDLTAEKCGFSWYDVSKLEHQLVNIRHLQGHVGQLSELLMAKGIEVDWVSRGPRKKIG